MLGWIVRTGFSDPGEKNGEVLGEDARIYVFDARELPEGMEVPLLTACVSFTPVKGEDGRDIAEIGGSLPEATDPETERIDAAMRQCLSAKRYLHSFRVSRIAWSLARRFGASPEKARIAGLLHDIAKENTMEENTRIIRESGMPIASFELRYHSIVHAAAGAVLARRLMGTEDPDILDAIRYHNGRPAMKLLEKLLFLADHVDYEYKNRLELGEIVGERELDRAIFRCFVHVNGIIVKDRMKTDTVTECTMNYMFQRLNRDAAVSEPKQADRTAIPDGLFDRMLEADRLRSRALRSVKNLRELGGCSVADGRRVRRGLLFRSGCLSGMTEEDAEGLAGMGVGTIVDLRSDREVREAPDRNTERFEYLHCPLAALEMSEYQRNVLELYALAAPGEEKTFYLSEVLSCVDMKEMYKSILTDESSVQNLRRIFALLCEPERGGLLLHCTSGKDRTGVAAALILLALGAPAEEIRVDYYTSALATFAETEYMAQELRRKNYSGPFIDEVRYLNGIGTRIAENAWDEVRSRYGSAENYLKNVLLLTEEKLAFLRQRFTE